MNYTRRKFLQQAGKVSLATTVCSGLPLLSRAQCQPFDPGIRIFFIGTWLFCANPSGSGILAIAVDMEESTGISHKFVYGVWPGNGSQNGINGRDSLCPNPSPNAANQPDAYTVTLGAYNTSKTAQTVFNESACNYGFNYIQNSVNPWKPDFSDPTIRVISIPTPTSLLPSNLLASSTLASTDKDHPFYACPSVPVGQPASPGMAASAHVFNYVGASSLAFRDDPLIKAGSDYQSDYHFHTVPDCGQKKCPPHGPAMFDALMKKVLRLQSGTVGLKSSPSNPDEVPQQGTSVPSCVSSTELDVGLSDAKRGKLAMPHTTTASCAGASVGLGS